MMEKRWETKDISEKHTKYLAKAAGVPLPIAELLVAIGIEDPQEAMLFLKPDFRMLHNPFLMLDMEKAVARILLAIKNGERILVHADYDCDGVTTAALFKECFRLLGVEVDVYAPNRFTDGYGLNPKNMDRFAREYDLIISGDTGIKAFPAGQLVEEINHADLIVTDHHEPLEGHIEREIFDNLKRKENDIDEISKMDVNKIKKEDYEKLQKKKEEAEIKLKKYSVLYEQGYLPRTMTEEEKITILFDLGIVPQETDVELVHDHFIALPKAYAVVNPKRLGDTYPCKSLSGVAVVFKLFQAIFVEKNLDMKPLLNLLDIVATGLVADLVQQVDKKETIYGKSNNFEVRVMTAFGLKVMNKSPKAWVKSICEVQSIKLDDGEEIDSTHLGFRFGPLLNAPGRLKDPTPAVDLLLEKDPDKSLAIARELKQINTERQEQTSVYQFVSQDLKEKGETYYDYGIVVQSDEFHIGIAGLIAGKLCEEYYRPSIALAPVQKDGKTVLKGSARSIPGVNVVKVMGEVQKEIGFFEHGGHEQAAGLTLYPEQFEPFREAFRKECMKHSEETFIPLFKYDSVITFDDIMKHDPLAHPDVTFYPFMKFMKLLEPFGQENKQPVFRANNVEIQSMDPIMEGKGYRLTFKTNYGTLKGISFKGGEEALPSYASAIESSGTALVDLLFSVSINTWNGKKSIQLNMEDIRFK